MSLKQLDFSESIKTWNTQVFNSQEADFVNFHENSEKYHSEIIPLKPKLKNLKNIEFQDASTENSTSQRRSEIIFVQPAKDCCVSTISEPEILSTPNKKSKKQTKKLPEDSDSESVSKKDDSKVSKYIFKQAWRNFLKASEQGLKILGDLQVENKKDPEKNKYWGKKKMRTFIKDNSDMVMTIKGRSLRLKPALIYFIEHILQPSSFSNQVTQATREYFMNHKREIVEDIMGQKVDMADVREVIGNSNSGSVNSKRKIACVYREEFSEPSSGAGSPVKHVQTDQAWNDSIVTNIPENYIDYSGCEPVSSEKSIFDPIRLGKDILDYACDEISYYFDSIVTL